MPPTDFVVPDTAGGAVAHAPACYSCWENEGGASPIRATRNTYEKKARREAGAMYPPVQLYLIRPGETAWSLSGKHGCWPARACARTICTLAGLDADAPIETDLAEWDYGEFEGLSTAETARMHPHSDAWADDCVGGEMPTDISMRADRLIAWLLRLSGNLALFSHGQFARALAARWIGFPVREGRHFAVDTVTIGILSFETVRLKRRII